MAWSTRELATLCGTTVAAIRHYHRLGLLGLPDRRPNGYKEYGVEHLVTVLRIRRFSALGVPLSEIETASSGDEDTIQVLRTLDIELAAEIDRLTQARADIAAILIGRESVRLPSGFENAPEQLSTADQSIVHIYSQLLEGQQLADLQRLVQEEINQADTEFDHLPDDADETTRAQLAVRLAPTVERYLRAYPWLKNPASHMTRRIQRPDVVMSDALAELYSPAQLDVLARARAIVDTTLASSPDPDAP